MHRIFISIVLLLTFACGREEPEPQDILMCKTLETGEVYKVAVLQATNGGSGERFSNTLKEMGFERCWE